MGNYVGDAGVFLIDTVFGLYILVLMLRFLLQWVGADFYNPISQFVVAVTNPPLLALRRVIPDLFGIDLAALVLMLLLAVLKLYLIAWLSGADPGFVGVVVFAIGELMQLVVYVFMVTVFVRVILSWIAPGGYNPAVALLVSLTEPVMRPARRLIPALGGLDLSPIIVFLGLGLVLRLLVQPVLDLGRAMMFA
jgi:YggT family protein